MRRSRNATVTGEEDCLVLDFVDLSALSLCTLPSLFGTPRDLDLRGEDANVARRVWQQILFDYPGFELEAGALTLSEIQERAASFDPLGLRADAEVRAISANAWFSLGRHGLGLHFERRPARQSEVVVLKRAARGKAWEVSLDGKAMDRFSTIEEAVQAVDYEITRMGRAAAASALGRASWRRSPAPERLTRTLAKPRNAGASGPRPMTLAEALQLAVWQRVVGNGK
jgi:hypothetical protein